MNITEELISLEKQINRYKEFAGRLLREEHKIIEVSFRMAERDDLKNYLEEEAERYGESPSQGFPLSPLSSMFWQLSGKKSENKETGYFKIDTGIALMFINMTIEFLEGEKIKLLEYLLGKTDKKSPKVDESHLAFKMHKPTKIIIPPSSRDRD